MKSKSTPVVLAGAALLLCTSLAAAQDRRQQSPSDAQALTARVEDDQSAELARLKSQVVRLQDEAHQVSEHAARTRQVVAQIDEMLRDARLRGAPEQEMQAAMAERDRAIAEEREARARADQLLSQLHAAEADYSALKQAIDQKREQQMQALREQDLAATEQRRVQAQQAAEALYQDAVTLAQRPDAAQALHEAIVASELQQLQARYAGLQQRLAELEQLYKRGVVSQTELTETKTQADVVLAQMRQATLRGLLEKVEGERENFGNRNDPLKAEALTGEVLQTEFFRGYLDSVKRYSELSRDPADAAVAAVVTAADLLRGKGPEASITYFEPILQELSGSGDAASQAAEAAVRMQLAEAYHAAGRDEDALRVLRTLIIRKGSPRGEGEEAAQ